MGDAIDEVIDEVIVDAYGDYEQLSSFCQAFDDHARFPFRGHVVGAAVEVSAVEFDGDDRRGLSPRAAGRASPTRCRSST